MISDITGIDYELLKDKVAVVTGGGGVLCSTFAKAIAKCGAKVAILDLRKEAADKVADEIKAEGGIAIGVSANVLQKESLMQAKKEVNEAFGTCDILINGAGGNNPKGTTTLEYYNMGDEEKEDIAIIDHDYSETAFAPTCEEAGYILYTCACGDSYTEETAPALGHSEVKDEEKSVAPTCEAEGIDYYYCSNEGCEYTREQTVAATGHHFEKGEGIAATCENEGYTVTEIK